MATSDLSNSSLNLLNSESSLPNSDQTCQALPKSTQFCQKLPKLTQTYPSICDKHLAEWVQESGVNPAVVDLKRCLRSLTDRAVVAAKLGWKKYSDNLPLGWFLSGLDLATMKHQSFGQYKPDEEIRLNAEDEDTQKYLTPKKHLGPYDAIALPHATDKNYWQRILDDPSIPVDIDEGGKKSGAGMTCGFPSLALCGVAMWQFKGELVSNLAALAVPGRTFRIRFDMDVLTKKEVRFEIKKLVKVLEERSCTVLVAMWNPELGLKIDDVLVKHGPEMVKKIMADAVPYPQWLKSLEAQMKESDSSTVDGKKKEKKQLPPPSTIAEKLAEIYREKLAWESEFQLWRHYGAKHDGLWDVETEETVKGLIHAHLRSQDLPGFTAGYVSSIATILQSDLEVTNWDEKTGLIPLRDGVLDQVSKELKPHAPGYRFTWQLPHRWADSHIGCQPIEDFLLKVTGCQAIANVLLAFLSAVVTRRADLQRYLELIGGGGTGKSTVMALARALAGDENTASSQLSHLETNQFETAKFYGKSLAIFPDSERWQGEVGNLKRLTGQDPIRYERKKVQQCKDYIFGGMVILSANEPIESKDKTSGLKRRQLTIPFDIRVPEYKNRNLKKEFELYIPGLLKRVLDISPEEVTRLIGDTDEQVPELAGKKWEQMYQTNDIARWLDDKVVLSPDLKTYVGTNDEVKRSSWLYASYCADRLEQNEKPISMKAFRPNLMDLLLNQLKVQVEAGEDRQGRFIKGVGLRCQHDPTGEIYPRPVTKNRYGGGGLMVDCGGCVVAESIGSGGWDGCDGLTESLLDTEKFQQKNPPITTKNQNCGGDDRNNPQHPPNPPLPGILATSKSPQSRQHPPHSLKTSPLPAAKIKVGDQVQMQSDYPGATELRGLQAVVIKDYSDGYYRIDFGREIEIPYMQPKQFFDMDRKYFQIVTKDEPDLQIPF